jgi:hypothetical protein
MIDAKCFLDPLGDLSPCTVIGHLKHVWIELIAIAAFYLCAICLEI